MHSALHWELTSTPKPIWALDLVIIFLSSWYRSFPCKPFRVTPSSALPGTFRQDTKTPQTTGNMEPGQYAVKQFCSVCLRLFPLRSELFAPEHLPQIHTFNPVKILDLWKSEEVRLDYHSGLGWFLLSVGFSVQFKSSKRNKYSEYSVSEFQLLLKSLETLRAFSA